MFDSQFNASVRDRGQREAKVKKAANGAPDSLFWDEEEEEGLGRDGWMDGWVGCFPWRVLLFVQV